MRNQTLSFCMYLREFTENLHSNSSRMFCLCLGAVYGHQNIFASSKTAHDVDLILLWNKCFMVQ